jgi:DNA-binding response OmpR family regulator
MRILLVEDDLRLAETLAEALTDQRYVVDIATDGEAGWYQVKTLDYDLLLLDVMLPELDGISLCHRLRAQGYNRL